MYSGIKGIRVNACFTQSTSDAIEYAIRFRQTLFLAMNFTSLTPAPALRLFCVCSNLRR